MHQKAARCTLSLLKTHPSLRVITGIKIGDTEVMVSDKELSEAAGNIPGDRLEGFVLEQLCL